MLAGQVAEPRHICEVGLDEDPALAVIVSSIVPFFDDTLDPGASSEVLSGRTGWR